MPAVETRVLTLDRAEVRDDGDRLRFSGHASVFDEPSDDLGGFVEYVQRGAFRKVLDRSPDVRLLYNHDPSLVLARTKSQTMRLTEDPRGLMVDADLAPTSVAQDLRVLIGRGDVDQMSFGFTVGSGNDEWEERDGQTVRTIRGFDELHDVSVVTFAAYPQTDAQVRSTVCGVALRTGGDLHVDRLRDLSQRVHAGAVPATGQERSALDAMFAQTDSLISPWMAERAARAFSQEPEPGAVIPGQTVSVEVTEAPSGQPQFRLAARRRRLRLKRT